jgi:hypothetical protein
MSTPSIADWTERATRGCRHFDATATLWDSTDFDSRVYFRRNPVTDEIRIELIELLRYAGACPVNLPRGVFVRAAAINEECEYELRKLARRELELDELANDDPGDPSWYADDLALAVRS